MDTNIPVNDEAVVEDELPQLDQPDLQPLNRRPNATRRIALGATMVGSLLIGGAAGVGALAGPAAVNAQSSTATVSSSPTTTGTTPTGAWAGHGPGNLGPNHEAVTDTSVAAKAIGISESDLVAALAKSQTIAQVAKAHSVDPQKVIDALVTDGLDELATAVKNGTITQAQADAQKAEVTQRATDQVNGTMPVMPH